MVAFKSMNAIITRARRCIASTSVYLLVQQIKASIQDREPNFRILLLPSLTVGLLTGSDAIDCTAQLLAPQ